MKICQQCGAEMLENMKFCGTCGAEYTPPEPEKRVCGSCNAEIPEGMKFCGSCGTAYVKSEPIPQPTPAPVQKVTQQNAPPQQQRYQQPIYQQPQPKQPQQQQPAFSNAVAMPKRKNNKILIIGIIAAGLIIAVIIGIIMVLSEDDGSSYTPKSNYNDRDYGDNNNNRVLNTCLESGCTRDTYDAYCSAHACKISSCDSSRDSSSSRGYCYYHEKLYTPNYGN